MNAGRPLAGALIDAGVVTVDPVGGFVWSSGLRAPLYCDHRSLLGLPAVRTTVVDGLVDLLRRHYAAAQVVVGVALAAVPWAAWAADALGLPLWVARPAPKPHGLGGLVDGVSTPAGPAVIVEDALSTGASVERARLAVWDLNVEVLGAVTILDYELAAAPRHEELPVHALYTWTDLRDELGERAAHATALPELDLWHARVGRGVRTLDAGSDERSEA